MKTVIVSQLLPEGIRAALYSAGFQSISAGKSTIIKNETAYHPDMLYFTLSDGTLLVPNNIDYTDNLCNCIRFLRSETKQETLYPKDCVLNCFYAKNSLIHGKYTASEILADCAKIGNKDITVKQGYAKCSVVEVSWNSFISGDSGIAAALRSLGCDVLEVTNSGIGLRGFSNGFIGGCALSYNDCVYFTGNLRLHTDGDKIKDFCLAHGKKVCSLSSEALYDYGGFVLL